MPSIARTALLRKFVHAQLTFSESAALLRCGVLDVAAVSLRRRVFYDQQSDGPFVEGERVFVTRGAWSTTLAALRDVIDGGMRSGDSRRARDALLLIRIVEELERGAGAARWTR